MIVDDIVLIWGVEWTANFGVFIGLLVNFSQVFDLVSLMGGLCKEILLHLLMEGILQKFLNMW